MPRDCDFDRDTGTYRHEPKAKKAPPPLPEWLNDTPSGIYRLQVDWMSKGPPPTEAVVQFIEMTREEYIRLKYELARIRGFKSPTGARLRILSKRVFEAKEPNDAA